MGRAEGNARDSQEINGRGDMAKGVPRAVKDEAFGEIRWSLDRAG